MMPTPGNDELRLGALKAEFMDEFGLNGDSAEHMVLLACIAGTEPVTSAIRKRLSENKTEITVSSVIQTLRHLPVETTELPPEVLQAYARKKWKKLRRAAAAGGNPIRNDGY